MKPAEFPDLMYAYAKGKAYAVVFDGKYMSYHIELEEAKKAKIALERQGYVNVSLSTVDGLIDE